MPNLNYPTSTKWVVAHDNDKIYHPCEVTPENCFESGQPFLEVFNSKGELLNTYPFLSGYYELPI